MKKKYMWIIAAIITIAAAVFQRMTGPTYPLKGEKEVSGQIIKYKLPRSAETGTNLVVSAPKVEGYEAFLVYKRYKTNDSLASIIMSEDSAGNLTASLPSLPAAGKYAYNIHYQKLQESNDRIVLSDKDVVVRFKGTVPSWILILHIFFIFFAMLFSNYTGILAFQNDALTMKWSMITLIFLVMGGFIFGPIVQKFAFGEFWTGFPFGYDLTDNKVLLSVLSWLIAWVLYKKYQSPRWFLLAAILTFIIYLIPHSLFGSELDFTTGIVKQG
jgi:hypothetical protein